MCITVQHFKYRAEGRIYITGTRLLLISRQPEMLSNRRYAYNAKANETNQFNAANKENKRERKTKGDGVESEKLYLKFHLMDNHFGSLEVS